MKTNEVFSVDASSVPVATTADVVAESLAAGRFHEYPERAQRGKLRDIGLLGWVASRIAGWLTGQRRMRDAEALAQGGNRLFVPWALTAGMTLLFNPLPGREREMAILRTAWNARNQSEWLHHIHISGAPGLSAHEIEQIKIGPEALCWNARERAILCAVDDLQQQYAISAPTWTSLAPELSRREIAALCYTVGGYTQIAMVVSSLGECVEADAWQRGPMAGLRNHTTELNSEQLHSPRNIRRMFATAATRMLAD